MTIWMKNPILLFILGTGVAYFSLIINQQFSISMNIASILSPTGAQVSVSGFRIKHWVVGVFFVFISTLISSSTKKYDLAKQSSFVMLGIGTMLIIDEYDAVTRFIKTGIYP